MKRLLLVFISIMMLISLAACAKSGTYTGDKIVMTYVTSPLNVPSVLDYNHGYYKDTFGKQGFGFDYSSITSGADQTAALASGDIQFLNAVGGSSVILAASNELDIVILSMYSRAPKAFAMFSNDEDINSPEALRGLKIAGPKGTNLHELLVAYLATADMTIDDVEFVAMDIPSAMAALEGGSVDVALAGGTSAYNAVEAGKHMICDGEGLIAATICTATTREFAENNPELVDEFLNTQQSIVDYMNENKDATIEETARALELSEEAVSNMYEMYDFPTQISSEDIELLQNTEGFLYESGMIEHHVDVNNLIYSR